MPKSRDEILKHMSEGEISEQLLMEYFDGIVLIDLAEDKIIQISEYLTGKLRKFINARINSYTVNMECLVDIFVPNKNRNPLKESMSLDCVRSKLDAQKIYNVDFQIKFGTSDDIVYKRVCYRCFDGCKDIIILLCKDTSNIITSGIDSLTGLYDSVGFHKQVKEWIENNPGRRYRIQRYDIDNFKDINGIYGYSMGNRLLRDLGHHMKKYDNKDSISAHLNADHFVRFCAEDSLTVQEYYDALKTCSDKYKLKIPISIHMGVYDLCEPYCNSFVMSYKALLALQSAKGKFNKPIAYYEKGMMVLEIEKQELLNDIDKALENNEFEVWFQPQIDYRKKSLMGAEALVRWRHSKKGLIPPDSFISILESSDKISDVDKYVINKTCEYMHKWMKQMPEQEIIVSVNLSRLDIQRQNFAQKLKDIVDRNDIPVSNIRLEITESAYMENSETLITVITELREKGFIIEMDDFGSGYSSFNTLKDIDIDVLKIDMKFLVGGCNTERSRVIISSVISMASALGLTIIAEGVETKEQADMLLGFGCELMQGYYFSKPIPAEEYEKMLEQDMNKKRTG